MSELKKSKEAFHTFYNIKNMKSGVNTYPDGAVLAVAAIGAEAGGEHVFPPCVTGPATPVCPVAIVTLVSSPTRLHVHCAWSSLCSSSPSSALSLHRISSENETVRQPVN